MIACIANIVLLSAFISLDLPAANKFNFVVSPPIVKLKLQPGSSKSVNITLFNREKSQLLLKVEKSSLGMDIDGRAIEGKEEPKSYSCAEWLTTSENIIKIPSNESVQIPVRINVPYGVQGGRYGIVLFSTMDKSERISDIEISGRMGSIFMIELFGKKKIAASMSEFTIEQENTTVNFLVMVRNNGNLHLTAKGSIIIKNRQMKIIDRISLDTGTGTILPEHERLFKAQWDNKIRMEPGEYTATLRIRVPGMGKLLQQDQKFDIRE